MLHIFLWLLMAMPDWIVPDLIHNKKSSGTSWKRGLLQMSPHCTHQFHSNPQHNVHLSYYCRSVLWHHTSFYRRTSSSPLPGFHWCSSTAYIGRVAWDKTWRIWPCLVQVFLLCTRLSCQGNWSTWWLKWRTLDLSKNNTKFTSISLKSIFNKVL